MIARTALVTFAAALYAASSFAGEAKIGGNFEAKINVKNITQVGLGKNVKQSITLGSVVGPGC